MTHDELHITGVATIVVPVADQEAALAFYGDDADGTSLLMVTAS